MTESRLTTHLSQTRRFKKQQKNLFWGQACPAIPLIDECTIQPVSRLHEDAVIEKQLTEKDVIRKALEAVQPEDSEASHEDQESDTDIDEICVI